MTLSSDAATGHPLAWLTERPIAHRGLHDGNVAVMENSLSAFEAAIAGGYAIECDVMLSKDRVPVVFHDASLERVTGATGSGSSVGWTIDTGLPGGTGSATILLDLATRTLGVTTTSDGVGSGPSGSCSVMRMRVWMCARARKRALTARLLHDSLLHSGE